MITRVKKFKLGDKVYSDTFGAITAPYFIQDTEKEHVILDIHNRKDENCNSDLILIMDDTGYISTYDELWFQSKLQKILGIHE